MRILFLGFEGVRYTREHARGTADSAEALEPVSIAALNEWAIRTGAELVVSSS